MPAGKPGLQHGIHGFRRFLLDPVGDAGKNTESQIGDIFFRAVGRANAEGDVGVAPEEERGDVDYGTSSPKKRRRSLRRRWRDTS